jgi:hypothetical protein
VAGVLNQVVAAVVGIVNDVMGATTPYGGTVLDHQPLIEDANALPLAVVWVSQRDERRWGYGGPLGGTKALDLQVVIDLRDSSHQPEIAEGRFRDLVDALCAALNTHQDLGGIAIWFGEEIHAAIDEPNGASGAVHYHAVIISTARLQRAPGS